MGESGWFLFSFLQEATLALSCSSPHPAPSLPLCVCACIGEMAPKGVLFHYLSQPHFWSKSETRIEFSTVSLSLLGELIACPKLLYNGRGRHPTLMGVFAVRQRTKIRRSGGSKFPCWWLQLLCWTEWVTQTLLKVGTQGPGWETDAGEEMVTVREQQAFLCVLKQGSWETGAWEPQELLCSNSQKVFVTVLATPEAQVGLSCARSQL